MEKKELSYTVSENVNQCSHCGEQYGPSLEKLKNRTSIWPSNPTLGHMSGEKLGSKVYMHPNVHCSTIYNSQDMKET